MPFYDRTVLPNGLRVITESIPHVRSASIGIWVGAGSYWETPTRMGVSHFIEHMLFKGTDRRTAKEIAQAIDGRGGTLNAFTAKEHTCYYAKVLDEHLPIAVDVLSDMLLHSLFDPTEMAKEKGVIVEEIKMYDDVPDDVVHDLFVETLWPDHPWGRPIVGTTQTVEALSREQMLAYFHTAYEPGNIVVAAAGHLQHEAVVAAVSSAFAGLPSKQGELPAPASVPAFTRSRARIRAKDTEQAHLVLGMNALSHDDPDLYALHLLNSIVGGGATSRLFQSIREERGLAYSVFSYQTSYRDAGNFGVYAGVSPKVLPQVMALITEILEGAGREGVTAAEITEAKESLKGQIMLSLESTSGRMNRLGRGELTLGRVLTPDQVIERIDSVTLDQVAALAERLFLKEARAVAVVGPKADRVDYASLGFAEVHNG